MEKIKVDLLFNRKCIISIWLELANQFSLTKVREKNARKKPTRESKSFRMKKKREKDGTKNQMIGWVGRQNDVMVLNVFGLKIEFDVIQISIHITDFFLFFSFIFWQKNSFFSPYFYDIHFSPSFLSLALSFSSLNKLNKWNWSWSM